MEAEELDDLADVQPKVRSSFVSRFSLYKQHGGTLSALDSNTGLPPSTYSRQMSHRSSSLSSLSTDSGFPMSCGSPSPTIDVTCFEDIDRKLRRTSSSVTSPKRVTSFKSLPSPTRFISVFTPKCNPNSERSDVESPHSKLQKSKSLSMSNLTSSKLVLHPQVFDSQPDVSITSTVENEQNSSHGNRSTETCSNDIDKKQSASSQVNITFKDIGPVKHYTETIQADKSVQKHLNSDQCTPGTVCEKSQNSEMCYSAYPLKTSSPRVPRLSRPIKFPADFRKSSASSSHKTTDCSQPCSRDTMTAQINAKNAVELNYGDYSDIDTVKVSAPEQHNPPGSLKHASCSDPAIIDSIPDDDHRKSERTEKTHTRPRQVRHASIVNQPEFHTKLPFTISKFEDTSKTVRKRIPPGMVADMRQMFSAPIRRRQTMPVLSDLNKYKSTLQTFEFPPVSNGGGICSATKEEMALSESSPEKDERYCGDDSSPGVSDEVVTNNSNSDENEVSRGLETSQKPDVFITKSVAKNERDNESDDEMSDDSETVNYQPDLQTSELNFYVQNGSLMHDDDDDDNESNDDSYSNDLDQYSNDSDDTAEEYNIYASKDDVTFRVRRPDDPPSTLTTPSYIDNILRLSRNSLNYDEENQRVNPSEDNNSDEESTESVQNYTDRSVETKSLYESKDNGDDDVVTSQNKPVIVPRRTVNMYSVINEIKDTDKQRRQSNLCTCIDLHTESREDDSNNTQTKGVVVRRNDKNVLHTDRTAGLHTEPGASTGEIESKGKTRLKNDKKNEQISEKGGIYCSRITVSPLAIGNKCTDGKLSINNTPTRSRVTFDKPRADDKLTEACPTPGERDTPEDDHVVLTNNTSPQVESKQCRTPRVVNVSSESSSSKPSDYNGDSSQGINSMPERSAGPTNNFSEISEYSGGKKITTKTSTTDVNMNETSEEAKQTLAILAEAMSKLNGDNNDDVLPEIKQSVSKLDGGNLVITTLTRKIIEEEEAVSSGRGTPIPDYNDVFYVRDHKGNIYMVEDLTEDSQESAYYSSSNVSQENDYNRIHNLRSVGQSNIDHATAEEVLLGLYNQGRSGVQIEEINENEKQLVVHKGNTAVDLHNQFSADSSFNKQSTKYEYDMANGGSQMPAQAGPRSTSKIKTIKQSYEMTSDGRSYKDGQPTEEDIKMETEETSTIKNMDSSGCKTMSSSFRYQTDASLLPQVVPETTVCAMPPPPMILPPALPKLVQLDMTPVLPVTTAVPLMSMVPVTTTKVTETSSDRIVTSTEDNDAKMKLSEHGRPVYKSVALVKGPYETPKWQVTKSKTEKINEDAEDSKRYKIVRSHASNETQQRELSFQNSSSRFHEISGCVNRAAVNENQNMYKSERVMHMNGGPVVEPKIHRTRIDVASPPLPRMDYGDGGMCEYSESNRTITTQKRQSEPVFPARVPSPPRLSASTAERDMRVVRGNILIKNTMDQGLEQFDDNINMFSNGFNMCKENPLYQSDEDLQRRLLEEEARERQRQMDQEVAFETCDRYSKTKQVKRDQPPAGRQNLTSQLLLSKLSNIDVKDIRQHIDVQHHNEDIYGDARFMHADGSSTMAGANNFDSVNENIDLVMRGGKAYITITVTAERYTPIDKEFNVWRKSQAVVTRVIEIDFLANEQRRRLYMSVMERAGECEGEADRSAYGGGFGGQERVLSTKETLDLFSEIMDATEGEGDHEDITVKTKQHRTTLPPHDFLY